MAASQWLKQTLSRKKTVSYFLGVSHVAAALDWLRR